MFYISSFGGSATLWLAASFSKHPDVVCFHGSRCFPPNPYNRNPVTPEVFIENLLDCEFATRDRKVFGHIHGFDGLAAKEATEAKDGVFAAMLRHPMKRIESLFSHYYDHRLQMPIDNGDIYQSIKDHGLARDSFTPMFNQHEVPLTQVEYQFMWVCEGTLRHDMECLAGLKPHQLIKMEEITTRPEYFAQVFRMMTKDKFPVTKEFLEYSFTEAFADADARNSHALKKRSPEEQFHAWPWSFKFIFANLAQHFGGSALWEVYERLGYAIPDAIKELNRKSKVA